MRVPLQDTSEFAEGFEFLDGEKTFASEDAVDDGCDVPFAQDEAVAIFPRRIFRVDVD